MNERSRGQVLPLFALMLVALFAMAALAIDVSNALQARREYRTIADAAALAGGQDLQAIGSRSVNPADYSNARGHAIESVARAYGVNPVTDVACVRTGDRSECSLAGLPFEFDVITPLPAGACATCDPERSIQVNFAHPTFALSFARVLGQNEWNVGVSAVAGLQFNKSYTIVALRPPKGEAIPDVRSMRVDGGTHVFVSTGDVGTNANMTYGGVNSWIQLDSGYRMYYYDPFNPPLWGTTNPESSSITELIADPFYPIPTRGSTPPVGTEDVAGCPARAADILANPNYAPSVPVDGLGAPDMTMIRCYTKGIYPNAAWDATVPNNAMAILEPGLYFFDDELFVNGSLIGGYTPNSEGVALVFRESAGTEFKNRTSSRLPSIVALNAGDRYLNPGGDEATAARDYSGGLVQTNTTPPVLMTVIVQRDTRCPVTFPYPESTCTNGVENTNKSIDLSGGSGLYLAGVQYAPTDNITLAGNTTTGGYVGQIWAWTIKYTGGSVINQEGTQAEKPGILRLDAACTAPGTPCIP